MLQGSGRGKPFWDRQGDCQCGEKECGLLSPVICSNWAWLFPGEVRHAATQGREPPSLSAIDFSVVASPLFITHCLSAMLRPSWEVSILTSDWISLFWVQA